MKLIVRSLFVHKQAPMVLSAENAVKLVKNNDRIYMHGVAAFPQTLAKSLALRHEELKNVEINHLHIEHNNPCSTAEFHKSKSFFIDNYFIGKNQRKNVADGISSIIPCFLSELPRLMRSGVRKPNVAFLNVSPPDKHGNCSLGIESCTAYAAAETADIVIAQINPHVPRTHGQTFIPYNMFDAVVHVDDPLPEFIASKPTDVHLRIGQHLSKIIPDGATLQMGIGSIPDAVLQSLTNHKNLGIHTEMFSDGVLDLFKAGVITNACKEYYPYRIVTSFVMGTKKLYSFVDDNPMVLFNDIEVVNNPRIIKKNPKVVAINSAVEVDITGQVCADSVGTKMISGVGGQLDFERGASLSKGGIPTICLPSTTKNGDSTITATLKEGAGVTTSRNHVHYVVTEYGIVNLFGKDLLERARLLISIAHPKHQEKLHQKAFERYKVLI